MAIRIAPLPQGTRVKVQRAAVPQDPALTGLFGTVLAASEYRAHEVGVQLDDNAAVHWFMPTELVVIDEVPIPPEQIAAKPRRALP
jgi:hypothetical protein